MPVLLHAHISDVFEILNIAGSTIADPYAHRSIQDQFSGRIVVSRERSIYSFKTY